MGSRGKPNRKGSSSNSGSHFQWLRHLERQTDALSRGVGQCDLKKVRAGVYKLMREVERCEKPFNGRGEVLVRARSLSRELADLNRERRREPSAPEGTALTGDMSLVLNTKLQRLTRESDRLLAECAESESSGSSPGSDIEWREGVLYARCTWLVTEIEQYVSDEAQRDELRRRVEDCRTRLLQRPGAQRSPVLKRLQEPETPAALRARQRQPLELDRHDRDDESSVSVPTVPFGLPGLGKRR